MKNPEQKNIQDNESEPVIDIDNVIKSPTYDELMQVYNDIMDKEYPEILEQIKNVSEKYQENKDDLIFPEFLDSLKDQKFTSFLKYLWT